MIKEIEFKENAELLFENFKLFLIEKNRRYGNSALAPVQIFSKNTPEDQILNRLDDKLSRIKNRGDTELKKNDVSDVFGYVALLMIKKQWTSFDELLD